MFSYALGLYTQRTAIHVYNLQWRFVENGIQADHFRYVLWNPAFILILALLLRFLANQTVSETTLQHMQMIDV